MKLSRSINSEAVAYWQRVRRFTPNARLMITSQVISRFGFGVWQAIFNLYLLSLGYSTTFLGGLLSLGIYTMAIGALLSGPYTQRVGEKHVLILSGIISALTAVVQLAFPDPFILLTMTALFYFGNSLQVTAYSPLMARSSTAYERTHLFGTSQASRIGASFFGSIFGGFLPAFFSLWLLVPLDSPITFQLALLAWFFPYAIGVIPLLLIREIQNAKAIEETSNSHQDVVNYDVEPKGHISILIKFVIISTFIGLGAGLIVPLINVWFWKFYNLPTYLVGIIVALGQATMATGVLLSPVLSSKIGKARTVVITQALSLPFIVIMAIIINPLAAILSYLLRGALMNAAMPVNTTLRMELIPSRWRPNLAALNQAAQSFGRATSVQVTGQFFDQGQYLLPFWLTLIFYGVQVILFAIFFGNAEMKLAEELESQKRSSNHELEIPIVLE